MVNLNSLKGKYGVVTDDVFGLITDTLSKIGKVVDDSVKDSDDVKAWAELVITKYRVGDRLYELWYQTRTPFSPKDMSCAFGFDEVEK